MYTPLFIVQLFAIAKLWKQPKWLSLHDWIKKIYHQFSSVAQWSLTLCNPMDCSPSGFPVHHQLPELAQTHIHWAGDAITISSSSIPFSSCLQSFSASGSFSISQFFSSASQSIGASASASVLPVNIQDWFPLGLIALISLQSRGLWSVFNTTVQKHQLFSTQLSFSSNSCIHTWLLEKQELGVDGPLLAE